MFAVQETLKTSLKIILGSKAVEYFRVSESDPINIYEPGSGAVGGRRGRFWGFQPPTQRFSSGLSQAAAEGLMT